MKPIKSVSFKDYKETVRKTYKFTANLGFLNGMGMILNLLGPYHNIDFKNSPEERDCQALESDRERMGKDFKVVIERFKIG